MPDRREILRGIMAGSAVAGTAALASGWAARSQAFEAAELGGRDRLFPVEAAGGMVVSREAHATRVGVDILEAGGNAVYAAVATAFALAVTLPQAGNLGGGGFALVHMAGGSEGGGETKALDFREEAPSGAHRDLFIGADGEVDNALSRYSHRSVGVPGSGAEYLDALDRWGTLSRDDVVAPAIRLALGGVPVTPTLHRNIARRMERFSKWPATLAVIARSDGSPLAVGDLLRQPDLAESLRLIAQDGAEAFYGGPIGALIAEEMARHDGLITEADLSAYETVLREPVRGRYRGLDIASMPPPSSGGVHLVQMLNILEGWNLGETGHNTAATLHRMRKRCGAPMPTVPCISATRTFGMCRSIG